MCPRFLDAMHILYIINLVIFGFNFDLFILFLRDVTFRKFLQSAGKDLYYVDILAYHYSSSMISKATYGDGSVDSG